MPDESPRPPKSVDAERPRHAAKGPEDPHVGLRTADDGFADGGAAEEAAEGNSSAAFEAKRRPPASETRVAE